MTWGIVGQDAAVDVLRRAVEDEARLAHAYLFVGPERVGKATAARRFAQALNCEARGRSSSPPTHPVGLFGVGDAPTPPAEGLRPSALPDAAPKEARAEDGDGEEQAPGLPPEADPPLAGESPGYDGEGAAGFQSAGQDAPPAMPGPESPGYEEKGAAGFQPAGQDAPPGMPGLESPGYEDKGAAGFQPAGRDTPPAGQSQVPCLQCRACRLIEEEKHPDVERLTVGGVCEESEHKDHSADNSRDIRICQVRRLERVVSRAPFEARYRVVIVDPADAMTVEAANAFLKTLEEPPAQVVLVLVTAREEALPQTVRSRCRRVAFAGVPREQIERALVERWGADAGTAARLARLAQGRLGWAVGALEDEDVLAERERTFGEIERLLGAGYGERFAYAASLGARWSRDQPAVRSTLSLWAECWRDILLAAAGREELVADSDRLDSVRAQASQYGIAGAVRALQAIREAGRHLEENANPVLALEVMLLHLPGPRASHRKEGRAARSA